MKLIWSLFIGAAAIVVAMVSIRIPSGVVDPELGFPIPTAQIQDLGQWHVLAELRAGVVRQRLFLVTSAPDDPDNEMYWRVAIVDETRRPLVDREGMVLVHSYALGNQTVFFLESRPATEVSQADIPIIETGAVAH